MKNKQYQECLSKNNLRYYEVLINNNDNSEVSRNNLRLVNLCILERFASLDLENSVDAKKKAHNLIRNLQEASEKISKTKHCFLDINKN